MCNISSILHCAYGYKESMAANPVLLGCSQHIHEADSVGITVLIIGIAVIVIVACSAMTPGQRICQATSPQ